MSLRNLNDNLKFNKEKESEVVTKHKNGFQTKNEQSDYKSSEIVAGTGRKKKVGQSNTERIN